MIAPFQFSVRAIREELGFSQSALATTVGMSVRAIQSYEQGWRQPSEMVQRVLLLMLIAHRNGNTIAGSRCWDYKNCALRVRERCIAYLTHQGHLCWLFTGTLCEGKRRTSWSAKLDTCLNCGFMQGMLHPNRPSGTDDDHP